MLRNKTSLVFTFLFLSSFCSMGQIDDDQTGAWYMYFWNKKIENSRIGFQGDIQYRNWNVIGDLEQLLLRGGLTYSPRKAEIKLTLGYANIQTGAFGDSNSRVNEHRVYQEALFPQKIGNRVYLNHRWRFEQRWVDDQDLRTRYRYNLFLNIPLNNPVFDPSTLYISLYNELFINGQRSIGNDQRVEIFDRNRTYGALGYVVKSGLRIQLGMMRQTTNSWAKNQLQLSLHHSF